MEVAACPMGPCGPGLPAAGARFSGGGQGRIHESWRGGGSLPGAGGASPQSGGARGRRASGPKRGVDLDRGLGALIIRRQQMVSPAELWEDLDNLTTSRASETGADEA